MTHLLTGPWGILSATPEELSAIGAVLAVATGLTVLIFWADPRWSTED